MDVEVCESCGGAFGPSAEAPPCLCQLAPLGAPDMPSQKGTSSEAVALKCPSCGAFLDEGARRCRFCRVELASVRCWCCFDLTYAGTSHCGRCGSRLGLEGDLGPTDQRCPGCDSDLLHTIDVGEHRVKECPECTGVMVDNETLAAITHARDAERGVRLVGAGETAKKIEAQTQVVYRKCPDCAKVMNRKNFGRCSGVIVDVCKAHGVWFDPDELTAVLEFVASGGMAKTRDREAADAKSELRRLRQKALSAQTTARQHAGHQEHGLGWASSGAFLTALSGFDW